MTCGFHLLENEKFASGKGATVSDASYINTSWSDPSFDNAGGKYDDLGILLLFWASPTAVNIDSWYGLVKNFWM